MVSGGNKETFFSSDKLCESDGVDGSVVSSVTHGSCTWGEVGESVILGVEP